VYGSGAGSDSAQIVEYYASQSDRMRQLAGFALIVAAAVFLAVFAAGIASRVEGPESFVVAVAGTASAVLLLGANALWAASAFTSELESGYHIDPRTHLILEDAGFAFFVSAAAAAVPFVVAASMGHVFPRWLALAGIPVAAALAASYFYFPFFGFLAWVVITSAMSLRRPQGA
jgi:hypothetical protein